MTHQLEMHNVLGCGTRKKYGQARITLKEVHERLAVFDFIPTSGNG